MLTVGLQGSGRQFIASLHGPRNLLGGGLGMRYMFAISATDPAGQLPQGSGSSVRASPQVTFIRMVSDSNFVNRATPFVRWVEHFESYCHEMLFERISPLCYPCGDLSAE